jgi:hypothetical protein
MVDMGSLSAAQQPMCSIRESEALAFYLLLAWRQVRCLHACGPAEHHALRVGHAPQLVDAALPFLNGHGRHELG